MGAQFPGRVWDGSSPTRSHGDASAEPSGGDWLQMIQEMQAVQTRLLQQLTNLNAAAPGVVVHQLTIADATADTSITIQDKIRVLDVFSVKTGGVGGAGDAIIVKNGTAIITDAISQAKSLKAISRASTLDPTNTDIAAGGTLKVSATHVTNVACTVYVLAVRIP